MPEGSGRDDHGAYTGPSPALEALREAGRVALRDLLRTPARFGAWLGRQVPGEGVGEQGNCVECALARFVREALPEYGYAGVGNSSVGVMVGPAAGYAQADLPRWAMAFVRLGDSRPLGRRTDAGRVLTREWALYALGLAEEWTRMWGAG